MAKDKNLTYLKRLTKATMKSVWVNEEKALSPWIKEHLQELSDLIGIPFGNNIETEKRVGHYEADIVVTTEGAEEETDLIVIENQFGKSDHCHLGKSLTYMTNLGAKTLIWISDSFTDEHKKTFDSLNQMTNTEYSFYAIALKVYQLDNTYIYDYEIVSGPDYEWKREREKYNKIRSESELRALNYWTNYENLIDNEEIKSRFRVISSGRPFSYISFPNSLFTIGVGYSVRERINYISVITRKKDIYEQLCKHFKGNLSDYPFEEREGKKNSEVLTMRWSKEFHNSISENIEWHLQVLNKIYTCANQYDHERYETT